MAQSAFNGPIASGDRPPGSPGGSNVGLVLLSQRQPISFNATLVSNVTFQLPANSRIVDVIFEATTVWNSATSATGTAGTASGGTQYLGNIDMRTGAVRKTSSYTAAQLLAMADIGANTSVVATVTSVGQPTAGTGSVHIIYVQTRGD